MPGEVIQADFRGRPTEALTEALFDLRARELILNKELAARALAGDEAAASAIRTSFGLRAFYPGSFDPITKGHQDVIERAAKLFAEVVVGVGVNPKKECVFTREDRVRLIEEAVSEIPNVSVLHYPGLTVKAAMEQGCRVLIRGVREITDYLAEYNTAETNRQISSKQIETLLIGADPALSGVSSSKVRELINSGAGVLQYATMPVAVATRNAISRPLLKERWDKLLHECLASGDPAESFSIITDHLSKPNRLHHSMWHVHEMFRNWESARTPAFEHALAFAIFGHDLVDSEEESAAIMCNTMKALKLSENLIERTRELIMITKRHIAPSTDLAAQILCDLDLGILQEIPNRYDEYVACVREEYSHYDDEEFRRGRSDLVLKPFLSRERLFYQAGLLGLSEEMARENMRRELGMLGA